MNNERKIVHLSIGYRCEDPYYSNFIVYSGGLCDIVRGICERIPYRVVVYTRRKDKPWVMENDLGLDSAVSYYPSPNVQVIGTPAVKLLKWDGEFNKSLSELYEIPKSETFAAKQAEMTREIDQNATVFKRLINGYDGIKLGRDKLILQAHDWLNAPIIYLTKKHFPKIPTIFQIHLSSPRESYEDKRLEFEKIGCESSDVNVAVSRSQAELILKLHKIDEEKLKVIPNGIDTRKWSPPKSFQEVEEIKEVKEKFGIKGPYVLSTGRYVWEKGHRELLLASEEFLQNHPDYYLVIAGFNGYMYDILRKIREEMPENVKERVILFEPHRRLMEREEIRLNQGCDLYVCLSYVEAFGLVLGKAMACGKAVVTSDIPTFREVLGDAGIRVKIEREEIVSGMEKALSNKSYYGNAARKRIEEKYSWDVIGKEYLKLYEELFEKID